MECPNCDFQNVPGLKACARCQSLLDFSSLTIDPPRAAEVALPLSLRHAAARTGISLRGWWADRVCDARSVFHPEVNWPALSRSLIPGWGHHHLGHRKFGGFLFGVWLVLVTFTVLLMGGADGRMSYFMLVGWHGMVISLILARPLNAQPIYRRALIGLLLYALLNIGIYLPIRWLIHGAIVPFTLTGVADVGILRDGDTVIQTGRWNRPEVFRAGDIVIYEIQAVSEPGAYIRGGVGVDRIVAGPGDSVSSDGSVLLVNGSPIGSGTRPLRPAPSIRPFGVTLGEDEYFIVPSLFGIQGQQTRGFQELFVRASVVPEGRITGKVLWRSRPWSRLGSIGESEGRS